MFLPAVFYTFVAFIIVVVFFVRRSKDATFISSQITGLLISLIAVLFFAYSKLSEEFMRSLNCVNVDEHNPHGSYNELAIARDLYWAEDTKVHCFEGQHRIVAAVGSVGLIAITIGAPAGLCTLVLYLRSHDLLFQPIYMKRFGFLYQAYHLNTVYWEVLILLRKAAIVAIVVFGHGLGANLQSILALGILVAALVVHMLLWPFKYDHLNRMESASLIVSIFTIYSGLLFHEPEMGNGARSAVTVLVLVGNAGLFVFLLSRSLVQFDRYAQSKLSFYGVSIPKNPLVRYMKFMAYFVVTSLPEKYSEKFENLASKWKSCSPKHGSRTGQNEESNSGDD